MNRREELRSNALSDLREHEVLMLDGHFDYGNGFHGRVYLNPHRIFRQPVAHLAARAGSDRDSSRPRSSLDRSGGRSGHGRRAARAHDRRSARRPPQPDASADEFRAALARRERPAGRCAPFYRSVVEGRRVLLADDVRNTGETFARAKAAIEEAGGTVIAHGRDLRSSRGHRRRRRAEFRADRVPRAGESSGGQLPAVPGRYAVTRF